MKILLVLIALVIGTSVNAQIIDRFLKRKAKEVERKVEQRLEQKVDENIDKNLNKAFEGKPNKQGEKSSGTSSAPDISPESGGSTAHGFSMGGEDVAVRDRYNFTMNIQMKVSTGGLEHQEMNLLFNEEQPYYAMAIDMSEEGSTQSTIMVMEADQTVNFMEMDGMKMRMANSIGMNALINNASMDIDDQQEAVDFKKTGASKDIFGYRCEEYKVESDNTTLIFWIAPTLNISNFFMSNANKAIGNSGFMMEYEAYEDNAFVGSMKVTGINKDYNKTINSSDYMNAMGK